MQRCEKLKPVPFEVGHVTIQLQHHSTTQFGWLLAGKYISRGVYKVSFGWRKVSVFNGRCDSGQWVNAAAMASSG